MIVIRQYSKNDRQQIIELWKTCDLTRPWNNPEKYVARKNRDKNGKFLVGQIDEVLTASIMIGYDVHRGRANYLAVDPDLSSAGYARF